MGADRKITLQRPAAEEPRAPLLRARAAAAPRHGSRSSSTTRTASRCSPRRSRRGAFALIQELREPLDRREVAERWFRDEYEPVVEMLREADLIGKRTETEAYMAISGLRYMLLRTHDWDEHVIERLREELR